jgi:TolB-like protein/Flp pilus assembly protein TadD
VIGRTLGHYRITAAIGAGGMGEVYRAADTKLGREVALKVLPAEMTADSDRIERFQREARALAALDHPGIVTVFSVEESDGVHFLTMQLVDGQPLDRIIPAEGLPLERIIAIGTALAEALAAAHERGIVHRDLKPSNVMVTSDGRVKVLDFGLAKVSEPGTEPEATVSHVLTQAGAVMGTMPYMSPEQVSGRPVDHRTDVFALGVVLYEMATGRRPFQGASSAELVSAIMRDTPAGVADLRADAPAELARLIGRCLEKDVRRRIQTARDVGNELADLAPAAAPPRSAAPGSGAARLEEGFWIAVLPFKCTGGNADLASLAEGLTAEIVTGLSRFSYLRVIAHGSIARHAGEAADVRAAGSALGARYLMEGSLRQAGAKLRLTVQLVDAASGAHLWAENYERTFSPGTVFELQDELVPRIVSTIADLHGVLPRSMGEAVRRRPPDQLSPYEAVLRSFTYFQRVTAEELATARSALELAVQKAPAYADAWAMLALLCAQEYGQGFDLLPDPLGSGAVAARRAVDAGPTNHLAHFSLAQVLFFRKELDAFRNEAERAVALNPMDGNSIAFLGELLTYAGASERGLALAAQAKQLNPNHPGWYWYADFFHHYGCRDYPAALAAIRKVDLPGHWGSSCALAAVCGQLGQREEAEKALRKLLALRPNFAKVARGEFAKWWGPELVEHLVDGLRKAGLDLDPAPAPPSPAAAAVSPRAPGSGAARVDEGFWVAVLPFKHGGTSPDLGALADGLSEEIVTGLSRFSYLRVIARGTTSRYAAAAGDARSIADEIGARFVMEGSVRQAGSQVRVAVQLIDASTGAHLWAETYNRPFRPDAAFELQDDLVPRIVSTSADHFGVLARAISDAVRGKPAEELTPYEALMRGFGYHFRLDPGEHAQARDVLEKAVERAPANADCWAMLSWVTSHEHAHGFNPRPGSLDRALAAARRAVDLAPSNHLAYQALAVALFFRKETAACLAAAERAIALNPLDGSNEAMFLITFAGDWERGVSLFRRAIDLNPHHPRWYELIIGLNEFRLGRHRAAVDEIVRANVPESFWRNAILAAAYGEIGDGAAARGAVRALLAERPDFARTGREHFAKWFDDGLVDRLMDGLHRAGLVEGAAAGPADAPASPAPAPARIAIAVLPFADMSAAKDQEYLCEGMAEEIMSALVRVDGIKVASRTSAFRASREGGDLAAIAHALSAGHVLEGSVRTAGGRLRVTAQLTDAATGYQLWSERFDRDAADVFAIQDEIAAGVVDAVKERLAPGHRAMAARPQVANVEAYRLYLQARHLRYTKNDHAGALRCFEAAIELDPSHAPSWVGLAEVKVVATFYGLLPAREAYESARAALATAAGLQGESGTALHTEGMIACAERDWPAAERLVRRAVALEPANVSALCWLGVIPTLLGRDEEAELSLARARDLDPLSPFPHAMTGMCLLAAGRPEEALRHDVQGHAFDPDNILALWGQGVALTALGRATEGIASLDRALALTRRGTLIHALLGWAYAVAGRSEEARAVLAELRQRPAPAPAIVGEAWLLAALGEVDAAWEVLRRAEEERQFLLLFTGMPGFDPLRGDPRWDALLQRLRLRHAPTRTGEGGDA